MIFFCLPTIRAVPDWLFSTDITKWLFLACIGDLQIDKFELVFQAVNEDGKKVGTFESDDPQVRLMDCDATEHRAITHFNNEKKTFINATWVAPADIELVKNGVKFEYTVVEEKTKFWANIKTEQTLTLTSSAITNSRVQNAFSLMLLLLAKNLL